MLSQTNNLDSFNSVYDFIEVRDHKPIHIEYSEKTQLYFDGHFRIVPKGSESNSGTVIDLANGKRKAILDLGYGFYPFITGTLAGAADFYYNGKNKDVELILICSGPETSPIDFHDYSKFIFKYLEDIGVSYRIISVKDGVRLIVDDKTTHIMINLHPEAINRVYSETRRYASNSKKIADKKVFISRKKAFREIDLPYEKRSTNHELLEQLFANLGFEIVYAEDFGTRMSDQIDFFDRVSVLAGLTGAGLSNMVFMRPQSKVIQLLNPVYIPVAYEHGKVVMSKDLHLFYNSMAFSMDHRILNITNKTNPELLYNDAALIRMLEVFSNA